MKLLCTFMCFIFPLPFPFYLRRSISIVNQFIQTRRANGNPKASAYIYIYTTNNVKVKLALRFDASSVNDM